MILSLEMVLLVLVVAMAGVALTVRHLMSASVVLGIYSFFMCLIWAGMGAVDVAFTEAAVGAGVSTIFFVLILFFTNASDDSRASIRTNILVGGLCVVFGYGLYVGVSDLPEWGDASSPVNTMVSPYFIKYAYSDTKVPNLVTAVLADYRAFDTMFETVVVFIATLGIIMLFRRESNQVEDGLTTNHAVHNSEVPMVMRLASQYMTPFIQLFGLYVVAHGHYSPGGGFQGGVILGASLILMAIANGTSFVESYFSVSAMMRLSILGVIIFAVWGLVPVLLGQSFLDYSAWSQWLPIDPVMIRSHSMLIVEIGVALTVMCGMYGIYVSMVSDGRLGNQA